MIISEIYIHSFYKKKGSKSDLNYDRGVFIVAKLRSILDRLVYNDIYYSDGFPRLQNKKVVVVLSFSNFISAAVYKPN